MEMWKVSLIVLICGVLLFGQFGLSSIPPLIDIPKDSYDRVMYWGSYRPGTYFGMKTRSHTPILTGMMWSPAYDFNGLRHNCRHEDYLKTYGWTMHNGRDFGKHEMLDEALNAKINAFFVKQNPDHPNGGSWSNRIDAQRIHAGASDALSLIYYIVFPQACSLEKLSAKKKGMPHIQITGHCPDVEDFTFLIETNGETPFSDTQKAATLKNYQFMGLKLDDENSWDIQHKVQNALRASYQDQVMKYAQRKGIDAHAVSKAAPKVIPTLPNIMDKDSNIFIFQKISQFPTTMDILFLQHQSLVESPTLSASQLNVFKSATSGDAFTDILRERVEDFSMDFDKRFHLREAQGFDNRVEPVAKSALSNMIGGMGYWYGDSLIFQGKGKEALVREAHSLFSCVPSRPFFPRGFLWDEGFHQLLISEWNASITMDVLRRWFNVMDESGWIPREQILGSEARSRVPHEFQPQHREHANPPAFFLTFDKLIRKFKKQIEKVESNAILFSDDNRVEATQEMLIASDEDLKQLFTFLKELYPRLSYWNSWFMKTQAGNIEFTFRWRGRTKDHTLSSGLDDFPRASNPSPNELHVDLLSWLAFSSQMLAQIADIIGEDSSTHKANLSGMINALEVHWDSQREIYSDIVNITSETVQFSPHIGYVNLFPLMLGLISSDSPRLLTIYKYMEDPKHLWSGHGIRSLSKSDVYYQQGENYWRGPIWMNMNYMILSSLKRNYFAGPYEKDARRIYDLLRSSLVNNVVHQFQLTGFLWEQYHEETGKGLRSHPFTGWSALVLPIISELF